jgi:hypothetical protein
MSLNRLGVYEGCHLAVNRHGERSENSSAVLNGGRLARSASENRLQSTALGIDEDECFGSQYDRGEDPTVIFGDVKQERRSGAGLAVLRQRGWCDTLRRAKRWGFAAWGLFAWLRNSIDKL